MTGNEKDPSDAGPDDVAPPLPDKQVHRWKDDGGAVGPDAAPEPDDED